MQTFVHVEQPDVETRLIELGLTIKILVEAIRAGELARATCTEFDPRIFRGQMAWARRRRSLCEQLVPMRGWVAHEDHNQPLVISPDGRMRIAVFAGDSATGDPTRRPQPQRPKGAVTIGAVRTNQLELFGPPKPEEEFDALTWFFLAHRTRLDILAELSLPATVSLDGRIVDWNERIILPSLSLRRLLEPVTRKQAEQRRIEVKVVRRN